MKAVLLTVLMCLMLTVAGCSMQATARADVYYPKENGGNVARSREAFHQTSRTRQNMGMYHRSN